LRSGDVRITASKHATAGTGEAEPTGDDSATIGARTATGTSRLRALPMTSPMIAAFSSSTDSAAGASVSCLIDGAGCRGGGASGPLSTRSRQGFGFRFWFFTGPKRNGRNSGISVLFGQFFWTKFDQNLNFLKKIYKIPQIQ
jgi:hypothetical protein